MGLFESIIEFKANIPSIMGLRLGESYHDSYDLIRLAQEKYTGDTITDNLLEYYGVFVDVDTDENDCINEITLTYYGNADVVVTFLRKSFNYSHFEELRKEDWVNCELERSYKCEISNDTYCIVVTQNIDGDNVSVIVTSQSNCVSVLQGANIYYYHEPLGLFAVNNSQLSLSLVNHAGVLSRSDVIDNLLLAMKLSNDYGEDWYLDYEIQFLHKEGTLKQMDIPGLLDNESYMRQIAEVITDEWGIYGSKAQDVLNLAGIGKELVPIEEFMKEDLLSGNIHNLEDYLGEMREEWTLNYVLQYESLDY